MINIFKNRKTAAALILLLAVAFPNQAEAKCAGKMIDLVKNVNWKCIFPITIGGIKKTGDGQADESITSPICSCVAGPLLGLVTTFNEPAFVVDTVKDAYCMNALGMQLSNKSGQGGGSLSIDVIAGRSDRIFADFHLMKFPVWSMLDLFKDMPCSEKNNKFEIAMMSEVLPNWKNEVLSLLLNPEALVFANPATSLACAADAVAASLGNPIDLLFWCIGGGSAYPFTGSKLANDRVEANAAIAAKALYMMSRTGLLLDPAVNACGLSYTPVWHKSHYKIQLMRPVKDACRPIGMPGSLWTAGKQDLSNSNYSWMIFRKVKCCVGL
jgi:conjugal transfer pilus assembly protein TraU